MDNILKISNLTKKYGNFTALDNISLDIPNGAVFGLLGPNGAGKTTLLRILNNILMPDNGSIILCGEPLSLNLSPKLGYMPEERGLYRKMRVDEQILYFGKLKGGDSALLRKNMEEYMEIFHVTENRRKKVEELSKGNQQKVQIIATLVHEPRLLVLDEPFSGFDPLNGQLLTQLIERLKSKGTTILLSSHNMPAIEEMCSDIALMNKGKIIKTGSIADIKESEKTGELELTVPVELSLPMLMDSGVFEDVQTIETKGSRKGFSYRLNLNPGYRNNDALHAVSYQAEVLYFKEVLPTLGELFIKYTKSSSVNS